jgi:hypothetical protein
MQIQKNSKPQGGAAKCPSHAFRGGEGYFSACEADFQETENNRHKKALQKFLLNFDYFQGF